MSLKRCCDRCGTSDKSKLKGAGLLIKQTTGAFIDEPQEKATVKIKGGLDLCTDCESVVEQIIRDSILGEYNVGESPVSDDVPGLAYELPEAGAEQIIEKDGLESSTFEEASDPMAESESIPDPIPEPIPTPEAPEAPQSLSSAKKQERIKPGRINLGVPGDV